MGQPPQEPPPWGTPDGADQFGTPDGANSFGSPDRGASFGTPDGSGSFGTPDGRARHDPLTADTVVVVERASFLTAGGYELTTVDDEPIGSLVRETSAAGMIFGGAASSTYRLLGVDGSLIGTMLRPGSFGRSRFVVTDSRGQQVGTIEQENAFLAPKFLLTTAEGLLLRLIGGQLGSRQWQLVDGLDESVLMGQVSQEYNGLSGMLGDTQRFAVQLSPQLVDGPRLLAVMATVCLDYVRDAKRRR